MLISPAQLAALAPNADAEVLAPALSSAAEERQIDTARRLAHWLGQLSVESGGFTRMVENLSYSAERLCQVWPGRFPTLAAAQPYARNPQGLAERAYGGRLGNHPGEGFLYRGRGLTQITGRDNYARFGQMIGVDLLAHPDKAAEPLNAARLAAAYWWAHGLNTLADADDIEAITRAINGGLTGLSDRKTAVAKAKRIFGIQQA
jgi:putative chitinase